MGMFYTSSVVSDRMLELIFRPKIDHWTNQISIQIALLQDIDTDSTLHKNLEIKKKTTLEKIHDIYLEIITTTICDPAVGHGIFLIRAFFYLAQQFSRFCTIC